MCLKGEKFYSRVSMPYLTPEIIGWPKKSQTKYIKEEKGKHEMYELWVYDYNRDYGLRIYRY